MNRRVFIKSGISAGIIAGAAASPFKNLAAIFSNPENQLIVSGANSYERFTKGIEFLGGIKRFVKKGQRVVIKPAMAFDQLPESGFNTNPFLVKEIIGQCYNAGAKVVSVFDHTVDSWTKCYKNSGIERIAKDAMARVLPANNEMYYTEVKSDNPRILKSVKIHNAILESDVFINLSVINRDKEGRLLASMANLLGCVWDRDFFTDHDYDQCLAELLFYLKPNLNIIDANLVPPTVKSEKPLSLDTQIFSTDIVAADSIVCQLLQIGPGSNGYIKIAEGFGFGDSTINLADLNHLIIKD